MANISHAVGYDIPVHGIQGSLHRALAALRAAWTQSSARIAEERRDRALRRDFDRLDARLLRDIGYDI